MLEFGREVCGNAAAAEQREWLATNGIGGFAMGTVAGMLTRRYHGLLVAALKPPLARTLLLAKLDETATYLERSYALFSNHWADGTLEPEGFHYLERFHLEGAIPVWTYALADALLEKRVWMEYGANTTYIHYHLARASAPVAVAAKALANTRDYHHTTTAGSWSMAVTAMANGLRLQAHEKAEPFYLHGRTAAFTPQNEWYANYYLPVEAYRGQDDDVDAHVYAALVEFTLQPGQSVCLVASTAAEADLDGQAALQRRRVYERGLLERADAAGQPGPVRQLVLAADQFIVRRATDRDADGRTVIAGYPWFSDWGRDTMIALPGLTLHTGRADDAATILRTFARFVDQGMLPNRFPDLGETPEYNTVDATLWYFEAVRAYLAARDDRELLGELFPVLESIVDWHRRGTRYNIKLDPQDGLVYAGQPGVQLTWMDAKVGDWVVTPRMGKPVEVNALWYNGLRTMADFAQRLGQPAGAYRELAEETARGFTRFWNARRGYCYDVLDGPDGNDAALRPNQLFAVSLAHSPLTVKRQRRVVDACARALLTSHGLRSLAADHPDYAGHYGGNLRRRDAAYHQGTVWGWLIGSFVAAHWRVYQDRVAAHRLLRPLLMHLTAHGLGSVSEIFDGDPPFSPRGCPAQAWSVAELLRVWYLIQPGQ